MTRSITETMHHIGNGFFTITASEKMAELVKRVNETGKSGKIDLTITVKKLVKNGAMQISGKVKSTMPADEPMETVLFATGDGALTPENPHQQKLNLTIITEEEKPLKTIDGAS